MSDGPNAVTELSTRQATPERASRSDVLLSVQDLRIHFDTKRGRVHAVDGVDLEIREGETLGLVGETGSGKSMSAKAMLRLVPVPPGVYASGRVLFRPRQRCASCQGDGCDTCGKLGRTPIPCPECGEQGCATCDGSGRQVVDLLSISERELRKIRGNRISMIFQDPGKALNPLLTVRAQLAEVFAEHRADEVLRDAGLGDSEGHRSSLLRRSARMRTTFLERRLLEVPPLRSRNRRIEAALDDRVAHALADTRIPNPRKVMDAFPHELSGGMKQRVMIAQALACDPDLLIADEPTTALDVTIQVRILDLISELQERHGTAVLYISHDLALVKRISDNVAVLYAGKLAESGSAAKVFADPLHPYTRGLLAASPGRHQKRGELAAIEGTVPELVDPPAYCRFSTRCPVAASVCENLEPPLNRRGESGHRVACFLYEDAEALGVSADAMPTEESRS